MIKDTESKDKNLASLLCTYVPVFI